MELAGPEFARQVRDWLGCRHVFVVTEANAAAISAIFEQKGELSPTEVRRLFPGVTENAKDAPWCETIDFTGGEVGEVGPLGVVSRHSEGVVLLSGLRHIGRSAVQSLIPQAAIGS
jgi:hypothetical protein